MQRIMEKSVPGSGPQFYFVFREEKLIGYNFSLVTLKDIRHSHGSLLVMQMSRKWLFVKK